MSLAKTRHTNEPMMICDCYKAGPDWDACDLPVVPLNCDGRCKIVAADDEKVTRYRQYIKDGGKPWNRGCDGRWPPSDTGEAKDTPGS